MHTKFMATVLATGVLAGACEDVDPATASGASENEMRFLAKVVGETGSAFTFLQAPDASFLVIERGTFAQAGQKLPARGGPADLYRAIAPRSPVPERVLTADRDNRLARSNGLLGTNWLPPPTPSERTETEAVVRAIEVATDVSTETGDHAGAADFQGRFCNDIPIEGTSACILDRVGSLNHEPVGEFGTVAHELTIGGQQGTARLSVDYETCFIGAFCSFEMNGVAAQGTFLRVFFRNDVYDINASVTGPVFHYASAYPD
jgi:hypothetical protein